MEDSINEGLQEHTKLNDSSGTASESVSDESDCLDHECEHCGKQFEKYKHLQKHLESHTGNPKTFECSICGRTLSKSSAASHLKYHEKHPTNGEECVYCHQIFTDLVSLHVHVPQKHPTMCHRNSDRRIHFKCPICEVVCKTRDQLVNCYRSHTGERPHACDKCPLRFATTRFLEKHKWVHEDEPQLCKYCGVNLFTRQAKFKHEKHHKNPNGTINFNCRECPSKLENKGYFAKHYMDHYQQRRYVCDKCNRRFKMKCILSSHIYDVHKDESMLEPEKERMKAIIEKKEFIKKTAKIECPICKKMVLNERNLSAHIGKGHPGARPFACDKCPKSFRSVTLMSKHVCGGRDESTPKPERNQTLEPEPKAEAQSEKEDHNRNASTSESTSMGEGSTEKDGRRRVECPICKKMVRSERHLPYHIGTNHTGQRPFSCDNCEKTFTTSMHLSKHKCAQNERPFSCDKCPITFTYADSLSKHECGAGGNNPQISTYCKYCGVNLFFRKFKLIHEQSHENPDGTVHFNCSDCPAKLKDKESFVEHYTQHYNEKRRHVCDQCGKRYEKKNKLDKHVKKVHKGNSNEKQSQRPGVERFFKNSTKSNKFPARSEERLSMKPRPPIEPVGYRISSNIQNEVDQQNIVANENFIHTFTSLPLSEVISERCSNDGKTTYIVWLRKFEPDVLAAALQIRPIMCVQMGVSELLEAVKVYPNAPESIISVSLPDGNSKVLEWHIIFFDRKDVFKLFNKTEFNSYAEVEEMIVNICRTENVVNIIRDLRKGPYPHLKEQLQNPTILCNSISE